MGTAILRQLKTSSHLAVVKYVGPEARRTRESIRLRRVRPFPSVHLLSGLVRRVHRVSSASVSKGIVLFLRDPCHLVGKFQLSGEGAGVSCQVPDVYRRHGRGVPCVRPHFPVLCTRIGSARGPVVFVNHRDLIGRSI